MRACGHGRSAAYASIPRRVRTTPPTGCERAGDAGLPTPNKAAPSVARWKEWVAGQVKKYEWDIDPEDADHPTIHGLRSTGILTRAEQCYDLDQIANKIGMSRQHVEHYMRFKDQMTAGADGQRRLRVVSNED